MWSVAPVSAIVSRCCNRLGVAEMGMTWLGEKLSRVANAGGRATVVALEEDGESDWANFILRPRGLRAREAAECPTPEVPGLVVRSTPGSGSAVT